MAKHDVAAERQLNGSPPAEQEQPEREIRAADGRQADQHVDDGIEMQVPKRLSSIRSATAVGVAAVVALGSLAVWLGYREYQAHRAQAQRNEFMEAARQGAVNLTTIDYTKIDRDIQRVLDSSTGSFHDDFQKRSQPFIEVVKKVQSKSEGTVTAAALESQEGDRAQVLVALSVKTSTAAAPEQEPRGWRMRINVQKVDDVAKISNAQFVP